MTTERLREMIHFFKNANISVVYLDMDKELIEHRVLSVDTKFPNWTESFLVILFKFHLVNNVFVSPKNKLYLLVR